MITSNRQKKDLFIYLEKLRKKNLLDSTEYLEEVLLSKNFIIFAGRGPSTGDLHLGHIVDLIILKKISRILKTKIFFQCADDEKIWQGKMKDQNTSKNLKKNLEFFGFKKTDILFFQDTKNYRQLCQKILETKILEQFRLRDLLAIFDKESLLNKNIGSVLYPLFQILPCFLFSNIIVICSRDQYAYFKVARDIISRLKLKNIVCLIIHRSIMALNGNLKMTASDSRSSQLLLNQPLNISWKKIKKAYSGGGLTIDDHKNKKINPLVDVTLSYLKIFTEIKYFDTIEKRYCQGLISSLKIKKIFFKIWSQFKLLLTQLKNNFKKNNILPYTNLKAN